MKKFVLFSIILLLTVVACSHKETEDVHEQIEVKLKTISELEVNKEIVIQALITQNETPVSDADEVVFEIWQHGKPDSYQSLTGIAKGEGIYEIAWNANEPGVYYILYHVTAKGMHQMKQNQFVVGNVDVEKILATPDKKPNRHMH